MKEQRKDEYSAVTAKTTSDMKESVIPKAVVGRHQETADETIPKEVRRRNTSDAGLQEFLASVNIMELDITSLLIPLVYTELSFQASTEVWSDLVKGTEREKPREVVGHIKLLNNNVNKTLITAELSGTINNNFSKEYWIIERNSESMISICENVLVTPQALNLIFSQSLIQFIRETKIRPLIRKTSRDNIDIISILSNIRVPHSLEFILYENLFQEFSTGLLMEVSLMDPVLNLAESIVKTKTEEGHNVSLLELLFGISTYCDNEGGSDDCRDTGVHFIPRRFSQLSRGVPIIVLRDYSLLSPRYTIMSWAHVLEFVLLRILREVVGASTDVNYWGPLKSRKDNKASNVNAITQSNLQWENYKKKVHIFDLFDLAHIDFKDVTGESEKKISIRDFLELFRNILTSLYSKGPGFVVAVVSSNDVHRKLCTELAMAGVPNLSPVICLDPAKTWKDPSESLILVISEFLILGTRSMNVENEINNTENKKRSPHTLRDLYILVEELVEKLDLILSPFVKRQDVGNEYDRHQYALKLLVLRALIDDLIGDEIDRVKSLREFYGKVSRLFNEGINGKRIGFEGIPWRADQRDVIPDIAFESNGKRVCIEIETLIGSEEPIKKIDESIEKYMTYGGLCDEVWVVLEPVSALIHYEELKIRQDHRDILYKGLPGELKFKVIAIQASATSPTKEVEIERVFLRDIKDFVSEIQNFITKYEGKG